MKYSQLIQFDPIESVIQLRDADKEDKSINLVKTYVISEGMAAQINNLIIPQLQFEKPNDNKGIFIVGNYGTGKSHLMSVVSTIAENSDVVEYINNEIVKEQATEIAGKFKVLRAEIGSTKMSLRDIVVQIIEEYLEELDIDYTFPSMDEVSNNKDCFIEMMSEFESVYPDKGFLLIVDELLDYLRGRKDTDIVNDLGFLREIGEVCKNSRFRFISGIQEALFDNPKFEYVSSSLSRVSQRFEQVSITRQDISYVVSQRLLKKNDDQKAYIKRHLEKFTELYNNMNENIDKFIDLYPIHPSFIDTFEKLFIAEKREILKTISHNIKNILNNDIDENSTGLISYDVYWSDIKDNPSLRSIPDIKEVLDKSSVLEDKIKTSFSRPAQVPVALRIINALSVNRLTTNDIYSKMGLSAEMLRDELCLYMPVPEFDSEFLKTTIESVLNQILKTVNKQFISKNEENQEYYLDLKKSVDYQAKIEQKMDDLSDENLNRYYFEVLTKVMELSDNTYVTNFRIWEHEVSWNEKNIGRTGYLFFGDSVERPTANPTRDFYINFKNPFGESKITDSSKRDEVNIILENKSEEFIESLKLYAAARELYVISTGESKKIYKDYSDGEYYRKVGKWLNDNLISAYSIEYDGSTKTLGECLIGSKSRRLGMRHTINEAVSRTLNSYFNEKSPQYPKFDTPVTLSNIGRVAEEAITWISTPRKTELGAKILDALELLDGNNLKPNKSRYVKEIVNLIETKGQGQVLNRSEVIYDDNGIEYGTKYRLEPEWIAVILSALVYTGEISLSIPGKKIDASNMEELSRTRLKDITEFKHVEKPKDIPLNSLIVLFEFFGIIPGQITNPDLRGEGVKNLQIEVNVLLDDVVKTNHNIKSDMKCWGISLISDTQKNIIIKNLEDLKVFLESLKVYNTEGKLKNFKFTPEDIKDKEICRQSLVKAKDIIKFKNIINKDIYYIENAEIILGDSTDWGIKLNNLKEEFETKVINDEISEGYINKLVTDLNSLKSEYIESYVNLHSKVRLNESQRGSKNSILKNDKIKSLEKLSGISILPVSQLDKFNQDINNIKICSELTRDDLRSRQTCPHCGFNPINEKSVEDVSYKLIEIGNRVDEIYDNWTNILLKHLQDPTSQNNISLLTAKQKEIVNEFINNRQLPKTIDTEFIRTISSVLSGLIKLEVDVQDLKKYLYNEGNPSTLDEVKRKFESYLEKEVASKDKTKVRVIFK